MTCCLISEQDPLTWASLSNFIGMPIVLVILIRHEAKGGQDRESSTGELSRSCIEIDRADGRQEIAKAQGSLLEDIHLMQR